MAFDTGDAGGRLFAARPRAVHKKDPDCQAAGVFQVSKATALGY